MKKINSIHELRDEKIRLAHQQEAGEKKIRETWQSLRDRKTRPLTETTSLLTGKFITKSLAALAATMLIKKVMRRR